MVGSSQRVPSESFRTRSISAVTLTIASLSVFGSDALVDDAAWSTTLPNPCSVLAEAHAQSTIARGQHVTVGKVQVSTSTATYKACSQVVGSITVFLGVSSFFGGSGGVAVTSVTHPSGLAAGDELGGQG